MQQKVHELKKESGLHRHEHFGVGRGVQYLIQSRKQLEDLCGVRDPLLDGLVEVEVNHLGHDHVAAHEEAVDSHKATGIDAERIPVIAFQAHVCDDAVVLQMVFGLHRELPVAVADADAAGHRLERHDL